MFPVALSLVALGFGGCALPHVELPPIGSPTVVVDAGHGGHDRGAISRGRVQEKTINLDTARRLGDELHRRGIRVVQTRTTDRFLSLEERCQIANRVRPKVFVSVHYNASRRRTSCGVETYYYRRSDRALAARVQRELVRATGGKDRGVISRRFHVLRNTRRPAILVECGFLTHRQESSRCADSGYRQRVARGIAEGIAGAIR